MRYSTKITETRGKLVYTARITPDRASRALGAEDTDAYMASYEAGEMIPRYDGGSIVVGAQYMILSLSPNNNIHRIRVADDNGRGWAGNCSPASYMYHGWRGTTCDTAAHAHGLRKLLSCEITGKRAQKVRVVFGPDISN